MTPTILLWWNPDAEKLSDTGENTEGGFMAGSTALKFPAVIEVYFGAVIVTPVGGVGGLITGTSKEVIVGKKGLIPLILGTIGVTIFIDGRVGLITPNETGSFSGWFTGMLIPNSISFELCSSLYDFFTKSPVLLCSP